MVAVGEASTTHKEAHHCIGAVIASAVLFQIRTIIADTPSHPRGAFRPSFA
ncbi:hypothetical protein [Bradyrhizobium commune]|uniref:Uncharacterized protein n=1 Tax=Bradyrhizobium commune TaxID=83627 RepID=A0A7S9GWP6_9BRAD|nr:hypothetical protein [Bradyrhizobium commune]QPF89010.1 hypothetical protein IC761_21085 [Bradyrhizobium commune]